jgi:hypothetical protein
VNPPVIDAAIEATRLSRTAFARLILRRSPRKVSAWIDRTEPVPDDVLRHLRWLLELSPEQRTAYVDTAVGLAHKRKSA